MQIRADLCVKPGVKVLFEPGANWEVFTEGSLEAKGTEAQPIVFKGVDWGPIKITSESPKNLFEYVMIEGAGTEYSDYGGGLTSAVLVGNPTTDKGIIAIRNSKISGGAGAGIHNFGTISELANTTISGVTGAPLETKLGGVPDLSQSNDFAGNGQDEILIATSRISENFTLFAGPVPYRLGFGLNDVDGLVEVKAELTIEAGASLNFEEKGGIIVDTDGKLTVAGTEASPVVFDKAQAAAEWGGIGIISDVANTINYAVIKNVGGVYPTAGYGVSTPNGEQAAIYVGNSTFKVGKVSVTNSTFEDNEGSAFFQFDMSTIMESDNEYNGSDVIVMQ